jgi:Carboxypeptidase regulatory-like domain
MKGLALFVATLLLASAAHSECAVVTSGNLSANLPPRNASRNVDITVNLYGKPAPEAVLTVSTPEGQFLFRVPLDSHGVGHLRDLKSGNYFLSATDHAYQFPMLLKVAADANASVTAYSMDLVSPSSADVEHITRMQVTEHVRQFTGSILDATGAPVPGAAVEIYPDGSWDPARALVVRVDGSGHFSAKLSNGLYRAIIRGTGFRANAVVFQIEPDAPTKDLTITLLIGSC